MELVSGKIVGSLTWPHGNQLFAIEAVSRTLTIGFPFEAPATPRQVKRWTQIFSRGITQ